MMRGFHTSGLDKSLLIAVLALLVIGFAAIYSASHVTAGWGKLVRQMVWAASGLLSLGVLACVDYRFWLRQWRWLYVVVLVALVATLLIARPINGARSWITLGSFSLQMSEFAKVALIVAFGALLSRFGSRLQLLPFFVRGLVFFAIPILLVLVQPDFGTAMVLCAIWFVMVCIAGARWWMLSAVTLGALLLFAFAWQVNLIKPYQKQRLDFIHADPAGSGYHQRQAVIAIGSGRLLGKGYLRGTQAQRGFLPEQETDFIFAVIGEEFGLAGCLVVIGLYLCIFIRVLRIAEEAETPFGRYIATGVLAMLAVHVIINTGMCLRLMPVTGVPLPLVSYGGSNLLTNLLAIGIVLNISRHRKSRREWANSEPLVRV